MKSKHITKIYYCPICQYRIKLVTPDFRDVGITKEQAHEVAQSILNKEVINHNNFAGHGVRINPVVH